LARVRWRREALLDLEAIAEHITRESPAGARQTIRQIRASTRRLKDFPQSGRLVPESEDDSVREVIARSYRVFYAIEEDTVTILGVQHGAMELTFGDLPND